MQALTRYDWPGNIRELQNLIERAVILSPGTTLNVPVEALTPRSPVPTPAALPKRSNRTIAATSSAPSTRAAG